MTTEKAQNGSSQLGAHRRQHQLRRRRRQAWKVWLQPETEQYPHSCLVNLKGFVFPFWFDF